MDEFVRLGRSEFLERYGFGKSRDFLVRDPHSGELCDSKAIVGVAYGYQFPEKGPLRPADFSGGEATVVPKLQSLGFDVVRIGEDWSAEEVGATVVSYFEMLRLDAECANYKKSDFNAALRLKLRGRSKALVELKHQNISAVLHGLAAHRHLERWLQRIMKFDENLLEIGASAGLAGDRLTVERVAT
jgi:hypothetical protein